MSALMEAVSIDARGLHYRELNQAIRQAVEAGADRIVLTNVMGQRYIGTNLFGAADEARLRSLVIEINGTPGNDLAAFMDGPTIIVRGNVMDGTGNTMNEGRIVAHGRAGDITGFSARGGEILVRDNAGYRVGIHMKEYKDKRPVLVIGGTAQDFLGEYMAGGIAIVMGLTLQPGEPHHGSHIGAGMHGGRMLIRGEVGDHQLGEGVGRIDPDADDVYVLRQYIALYGSEFGVDVSKVLPEDFAKLTPLSTRPYKQLYAY